MMKRHVLLCFLVVAAVCQPVQADQLHTVKSGENLNRIADGYLGQTASYGREELIRDISELNGLGPGGLKVGQTIVVPVLPPEDDRAVAKPGRDFEATGVYLSKWSAGSRRVFEVADRLTVCGANTVVFDVKDVSGELSYRSGIPAAFGCDVKYGAAIADIEKLVDYLHRMDIHVVARVSMFCDMLMATNMPRWRLQKDWINPADSEVQDYLLAVMRELIGYGVDEIQLDYVRYPADGRLDTTAAGMSRSDVIAGFLERVHAMTAASGVLLSLDVFGIVIWERAEDVLVIGQDIRKMKPHLDVISPMLYPSHFSDDFGGVKDPANEPYLLVNKAVRLLRSIVGDEVVIRPWLQAFPLKVDRFGPAYVQAQIMGATDAGARGWLLWSPGNYYKDSYVAMEQVMLAGARQNSKTAQPQPQTPVVEESSPAAAAPDITDASPEGQTGPGEH